MWGIVLVDVRIPVKVVVVEDAIILVLVIVQELANRIALVTAIGGARQHVIGVVMTYVKMALISV